jgi:hypothetical protein
LARKVGEIGGQLEHEVNGLDKGGGESEKIEELKGKVDGKTKAPAIRG